MKNVKYFAHFDETSGYLLGYYESTSRFIPCPAIEISYDDWLTALSIKANRFVDGELIHHSQPANIKPLKLIKW